MAQHNLKLIPLVQTFGHLEFALKRERFSHLRENKDNFTSVCPLNPESIELVYSMINQNLDFFLSLSSTP
jgi:hexosaminidase